ncbi:hypothetical protein OIU84_002015 [Salix udensis]|uniref:Mitochondrial carrier protein n=1 Tax=Salix udensis TaxID=889485 RepID=A0AAD6P7P3_9ROSI|nr:hypothetical protein OIU84_002015 [Salix udensis]
MGSEITRNQWEINHDGKRDDLSSTVALHGSHDHGGLAERRFCDAQVQKHSNGAAAATATKKDWNLGIGERVLSAAGAAFLSAIIVNPLDVVKTRLQAQAAGVAYSHPLSNITSRMAYFGPTMMFADRRCSPSCTRAGVHGTVLICPPDCFQYKGTLDVFYKIIRQEGIARLWRGTNAGLVLAMPTVGIYLPCYDLFRNWLEDLAAQNVPEPACRYLKHLKLVNLLEFGKHYTRSSPMSEVQTMFKTREATASCGQGMGAQLARDVPYSAICWSTLEPIRRSLLRSLAAAATCPLDVAKTRRQIEKDPVRALRMTTRQTLMEVWRDGGIRALFTGVGPRVGRAGPSVGIVVSFYEVVKYALHRRYATSRINGDWCTNKFFGSGVSNERRRRHGSNT